MFLKKLFSVSRIQKKGITYKVIRILGFKIQYVIFNPTDVQKMIRAENEKLAKRFNRNLVLLVFECLKGSKEEGLYALRNSVVCYVFTQKVLEWGAENFWTFIVNSSFNLSESLTFEKLSKTTRLYQKHIGRPKNEFLWKYRKIRQDCIAHKFLSFGQNHQIYVHDVEDKNLFKEKKLQGKTFKPKNRVRPYLEGMTVKEVMKLSNPAEQKEFLIRFLSWILKTYLRPDGLFDPCLCDVHRDNFIVDKQGNFHFIDNEFESDAPLSKEYVFRMLVGKAYPSVIRDLAVVFDFPPGLKEELIEEQEKDAAVTEDDYFIPFALWY